MQKRQALFSRPFVSLAAQAASTHLLEDNPSDLVSRAEFERLASINPMQLTDVQRAHRFYYLIMAGWGGELDYPRFQTSITDGGHGNRLIGALKHLRQKLLPVHERLRTVIIENLDWRECIDRYDRPQVVMYIDPPYPGNKANYAHNMREWNDHHELWKRLSATHCKWILSSYDTPETRQIASHYPIIPVQASSGMRMKKDDTTCVVNREILVMNFEPPSRPMSGELSLDQLEPDLGHDFHAEG